MKNPTNNFDQAAAAVKLALRSIDIEGSERVRQYDNSIILRKANLEVNIEAKVEVRFGDDRVLVKDDKDTEFMLSNILVKVDYQSSGWKSVESALEQSKFLTACCEAALEIKKAFLDPIYYEWTTVEERAESARKVNENVVIAAIKANSKGMRPGSFKSFCDGDFSDKLVAGSYTVEVGNKSFLATVSPSKVVGLTMIRK